MRIRKSSIPRPKILVQQKLYRIWSATGNQESNSSTTHTSLIHHQSRESTCKPKETSPRSRNSPEKLETATAVLHLHKWPHRSLKSGSKLTRKSSIEAPESAFHYEIGRSASWWPKNARESAYEGEGKEETKVGDLPPCCVKTLGDHVRCLSTVYSYVPNYVHVLSSSSVAIYRGWRKRVIDESSCLVDGDQNDFFEMKWNPF